MKKWGRRSDAIKKGKKGRKEGRKEVRISGGGIFTQGRKGERRATDETTTTRQLHEQTPFPAASTITYKQTWALVITPQF